MEIEAGHVQTVVLENWSDPDPQDSSALELQSAELFWALSTQHLLG